MTLACLLGRSLDSLKHDLGMLISVEIGINAINNAGPVTFVGGTVANAEKIASLERQLAGIQAALVELRPKHQLVAQRWRRVTDSTAID